MYGGSSEIKTYWINDLNYDLYCFWQCAQENIDLLVAEITEIKQKYDNGRELFQDLTREDLKLTDFEKAVRFFILNRITFSGTVDSGGYSQAAFTSRFTDSSIARLTQIAPLLASVKITNQDYEELLFAEGKEVFIFLDPPYYSRAVSFKLITADFESINLTEDSQVYLFLIKRVSHNN
jgi:DNA adenine methylase